MLTCSKNYCLRGRIGDLASTVFTPFMTTGVSFLGGYDCDLTLFVSMTCLLSPSRTRLTLITGTRLHSLPLFDLSVVSGDAKENSSELSVSASNGTIGYMGCKGYGRR